MVRQNDRCVMVIDKSLPLSIIADTAAIMGSIEFPVPILRGTPEIIKQIREKLCHPQ